MAEDKKDKLDIAALLEDDKKARAKETAQLKGVKDQKKRKFLLGFKIPVAVLAGALVVTLAVYDPFTQSLRWGDGVDQVAAGPGDSPSPSPSSSSTAQPVQWFETQDNLYPVPVDPWTETVYDASQEQTYQSEALQQYTATPKGLDTVAAILPSEALGYTSDTTKVLNDDGTINPLYAYWTRERFTSEVGVMLARLTNPVFGQWTDAGDVFSSGSTPLDDLFTPEWLEMNRNSRSSYPIYSDWDGTDTRDNSLVDGGARWVGTVNSMDATWLYNQSNFTYEATLTVNVTYTSWKTDKTTTGRNGMLILNLVAGDNELTDHHVLIDSATLEVTP